MWGRVVEIMTAVWLAVSPFVFRVQPSTNLIAVHSVAALLICIFAGLSYWPRTKYAHLSTLLVAIALMVWGRLAVVPPEPVHQNCIVVGLFLLMIAVVPNHASRPPEAWRETPA